MHIDQTNTPSRRELSDEEAAQLLDSIRLHPEFEKLTNDIIYMFLVNYAGVHGPEAQDIAEQILEDIIAWGQISDPPNNSCTRLGVDCWKFEAFPCLDSLEKMYLNMKNYPDLKIKEPEIFQRKKAVFEENFLSQFEPEFNP